MIYFHGSRYRFDQIDLSETECIGFHVGSMSQVLMRLNERLPTNRIPSLMDTFIYCVDINPSWMNSIKIRDVFEDNRLDLVKFELEHNSKIQEFLNSIEFEEIFKNSDNPVEISELLLSRGIQYLVYENECEGKGISVCILDDKIPIKRYNFVNLINKLSDLDELKRSM